MAAAAAWLDALSTRLALEPFVFSERKRIAVALSGGRDSTALLSALCHLGYGKQLRAIHINHGIHENSQKWVDHCAALADRFDVPFAVQSVHVDLASAKGLEAAARQARYTALSEAMQPDEVLCTAHHAADQLETQLYRLVRGSGVHGMRGVVEYSSFNRGYLARPLLRVQPDELWAFNEAQNLDWIEDPSNADDRFDRNFLRRNILPVLQQRWPVAASAAQRLSDSAADAIELAATLATTDLGRHIGCDQLDINALLALSPARRRNLLRFSIEKLGLAMPDARGLARLVAMVECNDNSGAVSWSGGVARIYKGSLFFSPLPRTQSGQMLLSSESALMTSFGQIRLQRGSGPGIPTKWIESGLTLGYRQGGEQFIPPGREKTQALKEWMREQDILPWMRDFIPLVFYKSELVAVADLELSALAAHQAADSETWQIVWDHSPRIQWASGA